MFFSSIVKLLSKLEALCFEHRSCQNKDIKMLSLFFLKVIVQAQPCAKVVAKYGNIAPLHAL